MRLVKEQKRKNWVKIEPIQVSERAVKVVYAWRVRSRKETSKEAYLNRPELWWVQGDGGTTASPGGWLRAFGRCLSFEGVTPKVILKDRRTKRELSFISDEASPYALRVSLPADLAEGRYAVRIHNGLGGRLGWSREIELESP